MFFLQLLIIVDIIYYRGEEIEENKCNEDTGF